MVLQKLLGGLKTAEAASAPLQIIIGVKIMPPLYGHLIVYKRWGGLSESIIDSFVSSGTF